MLVNNKGLLKLVKDYLLELCPQWERLELSPQWELSLWSTLHSESAALNWAHKKCEAHEGKVSLTSTRITEGKWRMVSKGHSPAALSVSEGYHLPIAVIALRVSEG